jgi:hypothetical protein
MTQTACNYQETVNTLQFGQKAKNVKTTVNVNESLKNGNKNDQNSHELKKAQKLIEDLQEKLRQAS